jgi:hypothetical protein
LFPFGLEKIFDPWLLGRAAVVPKGLDSFAQRLASGCCRNGHPAHKQMHCGEYLDRWLVNWLRRTLKNRTSDHSAHGF